MVLVLLLGYKYLESYHQQMIIYREISILELGKFLTCILNNQNHVLVFCNLTTDYLFLRLIDTEFTILPVIYILYKYWQSTDTDTSTSDLYVLLKFLC